MNKKMLNSCEEKKTETETKRVLEEQQIRYEVL